MNSKSCYQVFDRSTKEVLAVIGLCKNAGKTSFLNWMIAECAGIKIGVMTTGRDGEAVDVAFGNPKPSVKIPAKTVFCCDTTHVDLLGSRIQILQKLPWEAGSRGIWLAEAVQELETEIIGPSTVKAQTQCAVLMQEWGAVKVLIDGSIDRKSIALDSIVDAVFIVAGGSFGTSKQISAELRRLILLSNIPCPSDTMVNSHQLDKLKNAKTIYQETDGDWQDLNVASLLNVESDVWNDVTNDTKADVLYLPGALTESGFKKIHSWLMSNKTSLIVKHPYNVKLTASNVECLLQDIKVYALNRFEIRAIVLNPWSVTGNHLDVEGLRASLRSNFPSLDIIDIMELI